MIPSFALVTLLLASSAIATATAFPKAAPKATAPVRVRKCGSSVSAEKFAKLEAGFAQRVGRPSKAPLSKVSPRIPVHFHVISKDTLETGGNVSNSAIQRQIEVLNKSFKPTGLSFDLISVSRTVNATLFADALPETGLQNEMKSRLRTGGPAALNLYSTGFINGDGLLGYATFPFEYKAAPWDDGVVIAFDTLPGGTSEQFNLGMTAVHEVGHWVGLFHTFHGQSCDGAGDSVKDTPAQSSPTRGCPAKSDSCPNKKGEDLVHNFMDYSDDVCLNSFTKGQITRLKAQVRAFRTITI